MVSLEFRLGLIQFQKLTREVKNAQSPYKLYFSHIYSLSVILTHSLMLRIVSNVRLRDNIHSTGKALFNN